MRKTVVSHPLRPQKPFQKPTNLHWMAVVQVCHPLNLRPVYPVPAPGNPLLCLACCFLLLWPGIDWFAVNEPFFLWLSARHF